ncbi:zinc finger protein [Sesbania bispinosa]|nr:zinc finger protein [Sesbania bispinosa]
MGDDMRKLCNDLQLNVVDHEPEQPRFDKVLMAHNSPTDLNHDLVHVGSKGYDVNCSKNIAHMEKSSREAGPHYSSNINMLQSSSSAHMNEVEGNGLVANSHAGSGNKYELELLGRKTLKKLKEVGGNWLEESCHVGRDEILAHLNEVNVGMDVNVTTGCARGHGFVTLGCNTLNGLNEVECNGLLANGQVGHEENSSPSHYEGPSVLQVSNIESMRAIRILDSKWRG